MAGGSGKIRRGQGALKTIDSNFSKVKEYIATNASYQVSEISKVEIAEVNESYREYVLNSVDS